MKLLPSRFKRTPQDVKVLESKIEQIPEDLEVPEMNEDQLRTYEKYLERIMTDKEKKFIQLYETDPEIFGNKVRCYIRAYQIDDKDLVVDSNDYYKISSQAHWTWNKDRCKKYKELVQYKHGNSLQGTVALSQARLRTYIEQMEDKDLSLKAIQELNRVLKRTSDSVNVQVNSQTNVTNSGKQYDLTKLNENELETYLKLVEKMETTDD